VIVADESHEGSRPDANYHDRVGYRQNVFQVHGIDGAEEVVVRKQLRRSQVLAFFKALPPCLIGMEACATANW
jgi:transposase